MTPEEEMLRAKKGIGLMRPHRLYWDGDNDDFPVHTLILRCGGLKLLKELRQHIAHPPLPMTAMLLSIQAQMEQGSHVAIVMGPPGTGKSF